MFSTIVDQTIQWLLPAIVFGTAALLLVTRWARDTYPDATEAALYWLFVTSPLWFSFCLLLVIQSFTQIAQGDFTVSTNLLTVAAYILLCFVGSIVATDPAGCAFILVDAWQFQTAPNEVKASSLGGLIARINLYRNVVTCALLLLIGCVLSADMYLLSLVREQGSEFGYQMSVVFWSICGMMLLLDIWQELTRNNRAYLVGVAHPKLDVAKEALDVVAITAGIASPQLVIIEQGNPNAFTVYPYGKQPTVYLTTALLELADTNEIQVVLAHEIAHISLGRSRNYETIQVLLSILRSVGFFFFLLLLASLNKFAPFIWVAFVIQIELRQSAYWGDVTSLGSIVSFFNPPFLAISLISYLILYTLSFQEDYLADLQAVNYTRYPTALYDIFVKLEAYRAVELLPSEFSPLYFYGEGTCASVAPMPQPSVEERMMLVQRVDPDVVFPVAVVTATE